MKKIYLYHITLAAMTILNYKFWTEFDLVRRVDTVIIAAI